MTFDHRECRGYFEGWEELVRWRHVYGCDPNVPSRSPPARFSPQSTSQYLNKYQPIKQNLFIYFSYKFNFSINKNNKIIIITKIGEMQMNSNLNEES